ncbi:hypothetical protein HDE_11358 [Halotydeus destructor]|nr:hypothetical protein HDE_11358 [Halotydeus destructor]
MNLLPLVIYFAGCVIVATNGDNDREWLAHEVHYSTMTDSMVEDAIQAVKDGDRYHEEHLLKYIRHVPETLTGLEGDEFVRKEKLRAEGQMNSYCEGYFKGKYGGVWDCRILRGDYHGVELMQLGTPGIYFSLNATDSILDVFVDKRNSTQTVYRKEN